MRRISGLLAGAVAAAVLAVPGAAAAAPPQGQDGPDPTKWEPGKVATYADTGSGSR